MMSSLPPEGAVRDVAVNKDELIKFIYMVILQATKNRWEEGRDAMHQMGAKFCYCRAVFHAGQRGKAG